MVDTVHPSQGTAEHSTNGGKVSLRRGLGRTLFLWFVALALIPLFITSLVGLRQMDAALTQKSADTLSTAAILKTRIVKDYFYEQALNLRLQAELASSVKLLSGLVDSYQASNKPLGKFVGSYRSAVIAEEHRGDFTSFTQAYDLYDVLLISRQGDILFSIAAQDDLGTNLFHGAHAGTRFAAAVRKTLEDGYSTFSDLELYGPSGGEPASFLIQAMVDEDGERVGAMAVQLSLALVDRLMHDTVGLGRDGESYLIGADGLLRSNSRFGTTGAALQQQIDNPAVRDWLARDTTSSEPDANNANGKAPVFSYRSPRGEPVFGVYHPFEVSGVRLAVVSEIPTAEALADTQWLRTLLYITLAIMVVVVALAAWDAARHIAMPVIQLSRWARRIADGEIASENFKMPANEVGDLSQSFHAVVDSLKGVTKVSGAIADGDYTIDFSPRGDNDKLGAALMHMLATLREVAQVAKSVASGNLAARVDVTSERDQLGIALNEMTDYLSRADDIQKREQWMQAGTARLAEKMRGEQDMAALGTKIITQLAHHLEAQVGVFYTAGDAGELQLTGSYAYTRRKHLSNVFKPGEGVVGQAALERQMILLSEVPEDYMAVTSGLGEMVPRNLLVMPIESDDAVVAVIELGALDAFSDLQVKFLASVTEGIGIAVGTVRSHERVEALLEESQRQAETLQNQQEELKAANEELEEKSERLLQSERSLQGQSASLRQSNAELEEKTESLQRQKADIEDKNRLIELGRQDLEEKASQLELTSKYKSEFLANMSHELRTPLNSLLILANSLAQNEEGNLTDDQKKSAEIIHHGGMELLTLVNDVLDLSKVEAGKMEVLVEAMLFEELLEQTRQQFLPLAEEKGLAFDLSCNPAFPTPCIPIRRSAGRCSRTCSPMPSSLPRRVRCPCGCTRRLLTPASPAKGSITRTRWLCRYPTPESVCPMTSSGISSRPSSRPTAPPAAPTAVPVWG